MKELCLKIWKIYTEWVEDENTEIAGDRHVDQIEQFIEHLTDELGFKIIAEDMDRKEIALYRKALNSP